VQGEKAARGYFVYLEDPFRLKPGKEQSGGYKTEQEGGRGIVADEKEEQGWVPKYQIEGGRKKDQESGKLVTKKSMGKKTETAAARMIYPPREHDGEWGREGIERKELPALKGRSTKHEWGRANTQEAKIITKNQLGKGAGESRTEEEGSERKKSLGKK